MADQTTSPLHPAARRDLGRALQLLAMAGRRAGDAATPTLVGDAALEAVEGTPAAGCVEALVAVPKDLLPALYAQGWRDVSNGRGYHLGPPATGLELVLDVPASSVFGPTAVLDAGSGHALRYALADSLAPLK